MIVDINETLAAEGVDKLIADRLVERQRKMQRIREWESAPARRRKWMVAASAISVAACLAFVFFIRTPDNAPSAPDNGVAELMTRPEIGSFRAACPEMSEVESLVDAGEYDRALAVCESLLQHSDNVLKEYECLAQDHATDEEIDYELAIEGVTNHDIRWTYIYLLLHTGRKKEALEQVGKCMENAEYCDHIEEAKALRKNLMK